MAWNGSGSAGGSVAPQAPKKKSGASSPLWQKGALAGLVVVAIGAAVLYMMRPEEKPVTKAPKAAKTTKIAEQTPAVVATNKVETAPEKPKRLTKKGTPIPDKVHPDERGILRYPNGQRWVDPNDLHVVKHPQKRLLFKHTSENQIAVMLQLDPTKMAPFLVGRRLPYGERFVADFKESLKETPLVIDKDDTPEEAELRKAVLETKAELRERMEAGEDIAKIMNDTQKELDRLCQYHDELKKQVREAMNNPDLSDDDVTDFVTAANMLLEKQGIKQFTMPKFVNRQARLLLMRERQQALAAKKAAAERANQGK